MKQYEHPLYSTRLILFEIKLRYTSLVAHKMFSEGFKIPTIFCLEQIVQGMLHIDFFFILQIYLSDEQIFSCINTGTVKQSNITYIRSSLDSLEKINFNTSPRKASEFSSNILKFKWISDVSKISVSKTIPQNILSSTLFH